MGNKEIELIDGANLSQIVADPEASLLETCMAASISCNKTDRARQYADRVAKNKGKYYQHLYYFMDKYS